MIRRFAFIALLLALLSLAPSMAALDYGGVFQSGRSSNEVQTYYILLREKALVSFVLKDAKGQPCSGVFVSKLLLSSQESESLSKEEGISRYSVPVTGIYEVSVATSRPLNESVEYYLNVEEVFLQEEKEATEEGVLQNTLLEDSVAVKDLDLASDSNEIESLPVEQQELGPDSLAVESEDDGSNTNKPVAKSVNYTGKPQLVKVIDVYDFTADKSKSWLKSLSYDVYDNLWVLDGQLGRVHCYDASGSRVLTFGRKGKSEQEFGMPVSLTAIDEHILIGDRQKKNIHIFDRAGNWVDSIKSEPALGLKFSNPLSICDRKDEIWIADAGIDRALCFNKEFRFLGSFGSTKDSRIEGIAAIGSDLTSICILEENGNLKKFSPMGAFESAFSTDLKYPANLHVDRDKNLWITDSEKGRIFCFNPKGEQIFSMEGSVVEPSAISINSAAQIAVADNSSKQIKIFEIK